MNPDTIKLLIWAAMHHPEFARVRFEPFINVSAYATDKGTGLAIAISKAIVNVPAAIAVEFGVPAYEAGYEDEF